MKGYPRIWILALAAFIFTAPAPVYANNFAAMQLAATDDQDADQASEVSSSGTTTESDDDDGDLANQTTDADTANNSDDGTDTEVAEPVDTRLVDVVKLVVQNSDDEAIEEARIELSVVTNGSSFKKLTDDEGIAKFSQLPAELLNVKVTAPGYRSYRGEFTPENDEDPIVIKMRKRD